MATSEIEKHISLQYVKIHVYLSFNNEITIKNVTEQYIIFPFEYQTTRNKSLKTKSAIKYIFNHVIKCENKTEQNVLLHYTSLKLKS